MADETNVPQAMLTAQSRLSSAYVQVSGSGVQEASLTIPPDILALLLQIAASVLSSCLGGTQAKTMLSSHPILARWQTRRAMIASGGMGFSFREQRNMINAILVAGDQSSANEMDDFQAVSQ